MTKELWINLPVKNVQKTKDFFSSIGFALNEEKSNESMACFVVGEKKMAVLFFAHEVFREFTKAEIADAGKSTEMIISFDAENREAVDEMARRVFEAGGTIYSEPSEIQGWLYNVGFTDPDGHCWNMLYMDHSKLLVN